MFTRVAIIRPLHSLQTRRPAPGKSPRPERVHVTGCRSSLAERRRVENSAVRPQVVVAAREADGRLGADVALVDLAVVAHALDDVVGPVLREAEHATQVAFLTEKALDLGVVRFLHGVDVLGSEAEFLGDDERVAHPAGDVAPYVVAVAHDGAEGLLRDDFGQDHVRVRVLEHGALGREAGAVRRVGVAAVGGVVLARLGRVLDDDRFELHLVAAEIVGQIEFGRGARLNADRRAVELHGALDAEGLAGDEALPVVIHHADELEAQVHVALEGPRRVAGENVDFTRLKRREARLAGQRLVGHLVGIAENSGADGAAVIDVETSPDALVVGRGEAREAGVDAANEIAALFHRLQCRAGGEPGACGHYQDNNRAYYGGQVLFHAMSPSWTLSGIKKMKKRYLACA